MRSIETCRAIRQLEAWMTCSKCCTRSSIPFSDRGGQYEKPSYLGKKLRTGMGLAHQGSVTPDECAEGRDQQKRHLVGHGWTPGARGPVRTLAGAGPWGDDPVARPTPDERLRIRTAETSSPAAGSRPRRPVPENIRATDQCSAGSRLFPPTRVDRPFLYVKGIGQGNVWAGPCNRSRDAGLRRTCRRDLSNPVGGRDVGVRAE